MDDGTLRITNISKVDAGRYTCVARNHFGSSSSTGELVVKGISVSQVLATVPSRPGASNFCEGGKKKFQLKHEIENEIYDHFMFLPA